MTSSMQDNNFGAQFCEAVVEWVSGNLEPGDVFVTAVLEAWAKDNGFVKEES